MKNKKIPTAEKFWLDISTEDDIKKGYVLPNSCTKFMIEFAKLHVQAALEEASKEITEKKEPYQITKKAVLLSYPLENIK